MDLAELSKRLQAFTDDRDWAQFHAPKNLAAALIVEAAELLEHFQWMPEEDSRRLSAEKRAAVEEEVADVFLYLLQLGSALGIDLVDAAGRKLERNALKYPVQLAKGTSSKYTDLGS
jgi:dCTP diphosphatase